MTGGTKQSGPHISRRAVLGGLGGTAALATTGLLPNALFAQAQTRRYAFRIVREGSEIGTHEVTLEQSGNLLVVSTTVRIAVRVAFITAFRYEHDSEERWRDGQIITLKSKTHDNGEDYMVDGEIVDDGFRTEGPAGPFVSPSGIHSSNSMWREDFVEQRQLINVREGGVIGLAVKPQGTEKIEVAGRQVEAVKFQAITPQLGGFLWYNRTESWVRAELDVKGERVAYERM